MTLVFFLITPLQSAVLGTGEVLVKKPTTLIQSKEFMNPLSQAAQLDLVVFNTGYAITWLKQPYPAFTTADYALMPFKPQQVSQDLGTPANWTGVTTKYWTDLECWDAEKTLMWDEGPYAFFDGRSCNTSSIVAYGGLKPYRMQYIGWQNSAHADYSLGAPSCGKEAFNEFLAVWSYHKEGERSVDIGAKFCETSYFKQNVTASVRAGDFAPIPGSISPLGEPEKLIDAEFNSSAFQFLLGAGFSSVIIPRDYPFSHLMEQYPRLNNSGLTYPLSPLIGFAVGLQNFSVAEYRNGTVMDLAFKAAHRSLFSVAMQHVLVNRTSPLPYDGEVHYTRYGIIVSRPFSIVLEIGLIVIAAMTLMLCWECYRSACMLSEDPGSLASLMNVVRSSDKLLTEFLGKDTLTDEQLAREVGSYKFILKCGCLSQAGAASIDVLETSFLKAFEEGVNLEHSRHKGSGHYNPIKPVALHKGIGTIFLLFLAAGIAVLAVLKAREQELGGKLSNFPPIVIHADLWRTHSTLVQL